MEPINTAVAYLLNNLGLKATDGKGLAKKLEEAITKQSGKPSSPGGKTETKAEQKQAAAIRNAFTLGAPADDNEARKLALAAAQRFNSLEATRGIDPKELEDARMEADRWYKWAAMPKSTRENILSRGRRQAELGNATSKFGNVMSEMGGTDEMGNPRNKGAAELLRREAVANAGGPRITGETITDGRVTNRQVTGRYGSGSVVDTGTRGAGDPRLRAETEQLLLDQAARGTAPPRYDAQLAKYQRPESRAAQLAASLAPGTGAGPRDGSYAEQVLRDYQSRITPQGAMPQQQVAMATVPQYQPQQPLPLRMNFGESMDAYSILNAPAPSPITQPMNTRPMGGGGTSAFSQLQAPPIESFASPAPVAAPVQPVAVAQTPVARAADTLLQSDLANPENLDERARNNFMQSQAGQLLWNMTGGDAANRTPPGYYSAKVSNAIGDAGNRFYAGLGNALDPVLSQARRNLSQSALGQLLGMTSNR